MEITSIWRVAGSLTRCQHVGIIWRSLSDARLKLSLVSVMVIPVVTATRKRGRLPILKSIWTWDMRNFITYPSSVLLTLELWVTIRSFLNLLTLLNLLQKIIPYSMTMSDLHWSQRSLLKTTNRIILTPRLNKFCYSTWTTTLQLGIESHPRIRMVVSLILNHRLVWMLQWQISRRASKIPPSEMWWSAIWSFNHK